MRITHLNNSFIVIEAAGVKLVCDAWTGIANYGGWHALPLFASNDISAFAGDADYVYISHLHQDHLAPETLNMCGLTNSRFVINKNSVPTLRRRLESIGASEIIECEPFTPVRLGGLTVATIPQMTQNSDGIDCEVEYDLDSSILVTDGAHVFFNQVDNPLSPADCVEIGEWARRNFGPIDIAAMTCGAASEYPQCFINIDRYAEKSRVERAVVDRINDRLDGIRPRYIFPAGGTYFIPGRNAPLNPFIAVPTAETVRAPIGLRHPDLEIIALEGGGTAVLDDRSLIIENTLTPIHRDAATAIETTHDLAYGQDVIAPAEADSIIDDVFPLARDALRQKCIKDGFRLQATLSFALHDRMTIDPNGDLISSPTRTIALDLEAAHPDHRLVLHMDKSAFAEMLRGRMVWNITLSGSQVLYERDPNVFYPTDTSALNFLVHRGPIP